MIRDVINMITLEDAIKNATEFAENIYKKNLRNLDIEEVDLIRLDGYILVTLSWDDKPLPLTKLEAVAGIPKTMSRKYKTFYLDNESGEVKKMEDSE